MRIRTLVILFVVTPGVALAALFVYVFVSGPRMKVQPHIRSYQSLAPLPPHGTVAVEPLQRIGKGNTLPKRRVAVGAETLERGRTYYRYYCVFCHGEEGAGNGPVGESYNPKPADLRAGRIAAYDDGRLLRGMLTGMGHEPVLEQVVPPEHRQYLVLFVRSLGAPGR